MNRWIHRYQDKIRERQRTNQTGGMTFDIEDLEFIWDKALRR